MTEEFADEMREMEEKWQDRWDEERLFEADPSDEDKFYITVAYPYPSGGMHIGHVRTFALPDVFARFKRMQGFNVLFPMAWHVTGTPIIGALERLKEGEEDQLHVLRDVYNVPEETLESFEEPMDFARYFIENSYRKNMERMGFSIDWRREFTTNDDQYSRFIQWQYRRLKEKGLVEKGLHPTKYCLNDENPVTTHDLLEGEDAEKQEYSLVKFSSGGRIFPTATLRPETVYGVTHALINPDEDYVVAEVDGEEWVVSGEAAEKLSYQDHEVEILEEVSGEEFVGERVENPVTGEEVLLLPASFVDPDSGSGVVMSVPAHAPYDWISLQELKEGADELAEYGIDPEEVRQLEPKTIIDVEGYGEVPAREACEEEGVESQGDEEALERATEEVYEKEFHTGVLNEECGEFAGEKVNEVKDDLIERFEEEGAFGTMHDFSEEVVCRCGGKVIVSEQESWFLSYDDPAWKDRVHRALNDMELVPDNIREQFDHTVDWLESWPAIRNYGLGTRLPFDEDFVIEPLSDSTIYMAFYTIRHIIEDVDAEKLDPVFFDHVFKGEETAEKVADETGIDESVVEEARESFEYWYPLDWRTTANELIENHLTFMLYHHTALFDEEDWPRGIATWGLGTLEGEKMSSSKGHVKLPDNAIQEYGADTTRFFLFASAEPWQDFDWRKEELVNYRNKLRSFYNDVKELHGEGVEREENRLDRYVRSRLHRAVEEATEALENFETRKASMNVFFDLRNVFNWYRNRADELNREVVDEFLEHQVRMMAPFTPHLCEELWDEIGGEGFVSEAEWPEADEDAIDREVEAGEEVLEEAVSDMREIAGLVDDFDTVKVIVASGWKREAVKTIREQFEEGELETGEAMNVLTEDEELRKHGQELSSMVEDYREEPGELPPVVMEEGEELELFEEASGFLSTEFDAEVEIEREEESGEEKAGRSRPGKPAIVLE
ncbi:MAG: leucine--tRNA ligase [Candidatus Nanohaloarchaea archaeon]|nr:leucine--tRNA ligase [Candidatus Nanohaloarchaea archaeon]